MKGRQGKGRRAKGQSRGLCPGREELSSSSFIESPAGSLTAWQDLFPPLTRHNSSLRCGWHCDNRPHRSPGPGTPLGAPSGCLPRLHLVRVICLSTQLDVLAPPRECSRMGGQWLACVGAGTAPKGLQQTPFHLFRSEIYTAQPKPCAALPLSLPACGPSTHLGAP